MHGLMNVKLKIILINSENHKSQGVTTIVKINTDAEIHIKTELHSSDNIQNLSR